MQKDPKHYDKYFKIAIEEGMSYPRGRALVVCNRIQNGGWIQRVSHRVSTYEIISPGHPKFLEGEKQEMTMIKEATAIRWENHFNSGGSIKCLRRTTQEQTRLANSKKKRPEYVTCPTCGGMRRA